MTERSGEHELAVVASSIVVQKFAAEKAQKMSVVVGGVSTNFRAKEASSTAR